MTNTSIFTIGYGARSQDDFINALKEYEIQYLVDVRSRPFSKFKPEFSRDILFRKLKSEKINYVFMGKELGGQPDDPDCYIDGKVDYSMCKTKPFFRKGLERIRTASEKNLRVALMCSEGKPQDCHRCKLIGEALVESGMDVQHIDENGHLRSQAEVLSRITGGQLSLLAAPTFTSRKKYALPQ